MQNLLDDLIKALSTNQKYLIDGDTLLKNKIIEDALKCTPDLIKCLLKSDSLKNHFFTDIDGVLIFDSLKFQQFVSNKAFLADSYTAFQNKIGLTADDKFLKSSSDIVLSWAYKECILEAGMTKEDTKGNVAEIFYNETLAPDDVTRLKCPKVLSNFELWDMQAVKDNKPKTPETISINDNLLIKGNNLLALYSLRKKYAGKIKLIYIDPPYNTGNDGFRYNDSFNHSSLLTFMKNRLEVAKEILSDDGCIFVNLDDGESHYCKILMDEIWGRNNFVANIIWQKKFSPQNDARWFSDNHDHILCFAKNKEKWRPNLLPRTEEANARYSNPDNDPRGDWTSGDLLRKDVQKSGIYAIVTPSGKEYNPPIGRSWRVPEYKFKEMVLEKRIYFGDDNKNVPRIKRFLSEFKQGITPFTIWQYEEVGHTQDAMREIQTLDFGGVFSTPKPEKLIERIIHIATKPNDIVLDFFSGSGTTPAVAHKMGRRWIAIEQMDYIKDLPEARLKKVIEGEQGGISKAVNWQGGGSFIYCELAKWNENWVQKIRHSTTTQQLIDIYKTIVDNSFLNYKIGFKQFDMDSFKALAFREQQEIMLKLLNKNHLYVNYTERDDTQYQISDSDKRLSEIFYKN